MMRNKIQIAEFSVVNPEQSKFVKPVDTAVLNIINGGELDLPAYLNDLPKTSQPEQQNNTFWFLTAKNSGKTANQSPIQTRILKGLHELEQKKINPENKGESGENFLERFDWMTGQMHC